MLFNLQQIEQQWDKNKQYPIEQKTCSGTHTLPNTHIERVTCSPVC